MNKEYKKNNVTSHTLGWQKKEFWWNITKNNDLYIIRQFKNASKPLIKKITFYELKKIDSYASENSIFRLSNSVSKLYKGIENPGLGKFLFDELEWTVTECQLASQIVAIFTDAGIWKHNKKQRYMVFEKIEDNWLKLIVRHYKQLLKSTIIPQLMQKLVRRPPALTMIEDWIKQAKKLKRVVEY